MEPSQRGAIYSIASLMMAEGLDVVLDGHVAIAVSILFGTGTL